MCLFVFVDRDHLRSRGLAVQRNLFDQSTGLMRPKNRNGQFDHNFLPHRWGGAYTEGSAWHHSFPPYAIQELAKIHGGKVRNGTSGVIGRPCLVVRLFYYLFISMSPSVRDCMLMYASLSLVALRPFYFFFFLNQCEGQSVAQVA